VPPPEHSERLYQVAAWVAIMAGIVLIAVVALRFAWFFSS
jgi:MFS superfamily sulfate permease-like transporter